MRPKFENFDFLRDCQYWLEIIAEIRWLSWEQLKRDYEECSELLAIFTSIGKK